MTERWTTVSQRMATSTQLRNEDLSRRCGPLRYWLLMPTAWVLTYAGVIWLALVILSPLARVRVITHRRLEESS